MKNRLFQLVASCFVIILGAPLIAGAFPIAEPGTEGISVIVNSTEDVIATYQGNSAAYSNDLYLGSTFIFNNHASPVGGTVNLGSFPVGTELVFRLHVTNTGYDYFTGPAERNPDGMIHARVQGDWMPNETLVSFEDLYNGPFDYNDLSFSFTNVIAPPSVLNVPIDIKPSSCPNPLNFKSKGVVSVAILGTHELDVTQIDQASIRFADVAPLRSSLEDVATPYEPFNNKEDCSADCNDWEGDGFLDLTLKFDRQEIIAALGNVEDNECLTLVFTGNLKDEFGGDPIEGEDVIIIKKK